MQVTSSAPSVYMTPVQTITGSMNSNLSAAFSAVTGGAVSDTYIVEGIAFDTGGTNSISLNVTGSGITSFTSTSQVSGGGQCIFRYIFYQNPNDASKIVFEGMGVQSNALKSTNNDDAETDKDDWSLSFTPTIVGTAANNNGYYRFTLYRIKAT